MPSLYVFECVELELTLKLAAGDEEDPADSDFTCPIRLHGGQATVKRKPYDDLCFSFSVLMACCVHFVFQTLCVSTGTTAHTRQVFIV